MRTILILAVCQIPLTAQEIRGSVVDVNGHPVADVAVHVASYSSRLAYTDSLGEFVTESLSPGNYVLRFYKFGWVGFETKVNLSGSDITLPPWGMVFGDLDANGSVNLVDAALMNDELDLPVTNFNRYLDVDGSGKLDALDLDQVLNVMESDGVVAPEWIVSKPDYVTYVPTSENGKDATNQHYLMLALPARRLFGVWTQGSREAAPNQQMTFHVSNDDGRTWSEPRAIDGPLFDSRIASWGFSIFAPNFDRIYVFYAKDIGTRLNGVAEMFVKYTDDLGISWYGPFKFQFRRGDYSPSDTTIPPAWWVFQNPILVDGKPMVGFTEILNKPDTVGYSTEVRFMVFENILIERDVSKLQITTYPTGPYGLRGSYRANTDRSTVQEPSIANLPDGRLICVMRSGQGFPYYAVSLDTGKTWSAPAPLLYGDGQAVVPQPLAPCPLFQLSEGGYLLVFHNNNGDANGGVGPADLFHNRTPAYVSIGRDAGPGKLQPIEFSQPVMILENYVRPWGPDDRTEIATYPSLTEDETSYVLWYPDRKHFLLGKRLPKPISKLLLSR